MVSKPLQHSPELGPTQPHPFTTALLTKKKQVWLKMLIIAQFIEKCKKISSTTPTLCRAALLHCAEKMGKTMMPTLCLLR